MTTIYLIRHSEKLKKGIIQNNDFELDTIRYSRII